MNMPKRLTPEKTTFINVGGTMVPTSVLPDNIAQEFLIIDRMKAEAADLTYKLEVLSLAIKGKSQELGASVTAHMAAMNKQQEADKANAAATPLEPDDNK